MRIISKWKDYYDYLSWHFGQDNSIIYKRKPFSSEIGISKKDLPQLPNDVFINYRFKWLSICSVLFLLVEKREANGSYGPWKMYSTDDFSDEFNSKLNKNYFFNGSYTQHIGKSSPLVLELHKQVSAPVFCFVTVWNGCYIDDIIPKLDVLGIPSVYPAEQIYQDISYFIGNTLTPSPDTVVPNISSDKEKILQHGFDLKQSFRHRL